MKTLLCVAADQVLETVQLGEPLVGRSLGFGTLGGVQTVFHNALCTRGGRLMLLCPSGAGDNITNKTHFKPCSFSNWLNEHSASFGHKVVQKVSFPHNYFLNITLACHCHAFRHAQVMAMPHLGMLGCLQRPDEAWSALSMWQESGWRGRWHGRIASARCARWSSGRSPWTWRCRWLPVSAALVFGVYLLAQFFIRMFTNTIDLHEGIANICL